jgi:predicted  nucleic acid-binding Zn-ribbon protein
LKASPQEQQTLLDLQQLDTRLDQLAHRAANLPELARHADLTERLAEFHTDSVQAQTELSDLGEQVAKAELEVAGVRARAHKDQTLLDSGAISSGKQLEEIQHEITSLARRQTSLEDVELELMEQAEGVQARVDILSDTVAKTRAEIADVEQARDAVLGEISDEVITIELRRVKLVDDVPADLTALYQRLRGNLGGVGAAPLVGKHCEGCNMQLAPTDLSAIAAAAPDDVVRCEECSRILIRRGSA